MIENTREIKRLDRKRLIKAVACSVCFSIMLLLGYMIEHQEIRGRAAGFAVVALGHTVVGGIFVILLYGFFGSRIIVLESRLAFWKIYIISFGVLLILYFVSYLALYPGIYAFDAVPQTYAYLSHTITDNHPVLHTVILGAFMDGGAWQGSVNAGVSDYITFQYILNAACFSYMLSYIYTFTGRKWIYIVSVLYMGGFTPIVLQVMTTTKDGMFLPFFVLCMTLTIELNQMESKEAPVGKWILWSVSGVFMTIFRKNCILALPVLLICMYKNMPSQRKKVIVFSSLTVMFFMLYQMLFVPVFVSKKVDERELLSVFAQQMGRFYLDGETEITEEEKDMVEHLITREGLDSYQFRIADHAKGWMDMDYYHAHKKELWQTYFSLMMRNPGIAMMSFMELNSGLWYPGCELTLYPDGRKAYWIVQCFEPAEMQSRIPTLLAYYKLFESSEFATRNSFTAVLFAPATYFYLFLFFYMYSVNAEKKNFRPFFRFVLVYWGWYLFGPVALVRYVSFLFAIVPLYVLVIAQRKGDRA